MDRRRFVKSSLLTVGSLSLPPGLEAAPPGGKGPGGSTQNNKFGIEYIRKEIPHIEIPPYRGASYEDTVPDTLDIAERAKLGINCLTGITDDRADCEIFIGADFHRNPPVLSHDFNDWCQNVEGLMEGLPLLRVATGSTLRDQVDRVWMETLLKGIGPDGLLYIPFQGRPWSRVAICWITPVWRANGTTTDPSDKSVTQFTSPNVWPRAMAAMTIYYLRDQNPLWKQTIERMIQRMSELATDGGDCSFFPAGAYEPNLKFGYPGAGGPFIMPLGPLAMEGGNGRLIQGLAQYYSVTGYEPAQKLAGKLVAFMRHRAHYYDTEGRYLWYNADQVEGEIFGGHFHSHAIGILSMLEYAAAVRDRELLEWARSSYEWAKTQGSSLVGFFPEMILPNYPRTEGCAVADMIGLAANLSTSGVGDYWDDIDRWARNQFAENQLTEGEWIYRLTESMPKKPVAFNETSDRAVERNLGGFGGPRGNEFGTELGHCCTGNSVRSIYYIWEHIVQHENGRLRVNLLLNRASKWADVYSYIPYEGRVDVRIKQPCESLLMRAPEWVESNSPQLVCKVNGVPRGLNWDGRYVNVGAGKAGDTIVVAFPIGERTVKDKLGDTVYTLVIKGNTVVSIDPPGKNGALYARANYRENQVSWRKVKRFVAEEEIRW
jgi:hypothetical protein